jgi:hypothetical protein
VDWRVKIKIVDWRDRDFVGAFEADVADGLAHGLGLDRVELAERVEAALRDQGYPQARVAYSRSYTDLLAGIARWTVWRDRPAVNAS